MALTSQQIYRNCAQIAEDLGFPPVIPEFADLDLLIYLLKRYRSVNSAGFLADPKVKTARKDLAKVGYYFVPPEFFNRQERFHPDRCVHCSQTMTTLDIERSDRNLDDLPLSQYIGLLAKVFKLPLVVKASHFPAVHYVPSLHLLRVNLCPFCFEALFPQA